MLKNQTLQMRLTYTAHLYKALTRQHHLKLLPVLEKYIPKDGIVIDAGAHAGQFTKLFSRMVPKGRVYAFEPSSYALSILRKVVRVRGLRNVTLVPAGLSDAKTTETLRIPIKATGALGFGLSHLGDDRQVNPRQTLEESVPLTTLDDFAGEHDLKRIDFIKADIEGWELHMLKGAQQVLAQHRPVMVIEIWDSCLRRAGTSAGETLAYLTSRGYDVFNCNFASGTIEPLPEDFAKGNVLCVPTKGK